MSWWTWLIVGLYSLGVITGWLIVVGMAIDEDWKFSQLALCLVWPLVLMYMVVFNGDLPGWFERHWG